MWEPAEVVATPVEVVPAPAGGGGGSFNGGANPFGETGAQGNTGHGQLIITFMD